MAIIPTQYHESPPNARPHYACCRPLSHEQCKEGKTQQNSETRVFLRVHPFYQLCLCLRLCVCVYYCRTYYKAVRGRRRVCLSCAKTRTWMGVSTCVLLGARRQYQRGALDSASRHGLKGRGKGQVSRAPLQESVQTDRADTLLRACARCLVRMSNGFLFPVAKIRKP